MKNVLLMSACQFSISFAGSPKLITKQAEAAIQGQGGQFRGDDQAGIFELSVFGSAIRGSYTVLGQELNVTIDSKPFLVPCGTIQSYLQKYLQSGK